MDSHKKKRACPHYPQPYDDSDDGPLLWAGALATLPEEDHNNHSLKWYNFLGELPGNHFALFPHPENQAAFERVRETGQPVEFHARPFEYSDQPERGVTYWD